MPRIGCTSTSASRFGSVTLPGGVRPCLGHGQIRVRQPAAEMPVLLRVLVADNPRVDMTADISVKPTLTGPDVVRGRSPAATWRR